jgi:hypothetical protein
VRRVQGWAGFAAWAAAAALTAAAVAGAASVGLLLLPIAPVALGVVAARVRTWPEAVGTLEGPAAVLVLIGLLNLDRTPCPRNGTLVLPPGQHEVGCGGLAPAPYLIAGCILAVVAAALYRALREQRR